MASSGHHSGFTPRFPNRTGRHRMVTGAEIVATAALVLSTLAVAAVLSMGAAHAATPSPASHGGSLSHVIETLAGGLGGYAALRALQRD